jgi:hypothetical protein
VIVAKSQLGATFLDTLVGVIHTRVTIASTEDASATTDTSPLKHIIRHWTIQIFRLNWTEKKISIGNGATGKKHTGLTSMTRVGNIPAANTCMNQKDLTKTKYER